jgi:guanyl-specific ribonuclease Sa
MHQGEQSRGHVLTALWLHQLLGAAQPCQQDGATACMSSAQVTHKPAKAVRESDHAVQVQAGSASSSRVGEESEP